MTFAIKKVADLPHYSKFFDGFVKKWMYKLYLFEIITKMQLMLSFNRL